MRAADLRCDVGQVYETLTKQADVHAVGLWDAPPGAPQPGQALVVEVEEIASASAAGLPEKVILGGHELPVVLRATPKAAFHMADGVLDGSDLLVASGVGRVGTLGLVFAEAGTGRLFGLTNAHVVTRPDQDHTGDRIAAVVGGSEQEIGHVFYHSPFRTGIPNKVDMALIELNGLGKSLAQEFAIQTFAGKVTGSGGLSFSRFGGAHRPHKYGGSTSTSRDIVQCTGPAEHPFADLLDKSGARMRFGRVFLLSAAGNGVRPGHSGSVIVRETTPGDLLAVGLLAAGHGPAAVAFSMVDVIREIRQLGVVLA